MSKELKRTVTVTMHRTETREVQVAVEVPLDLTGVELNAHLMELAGDQDFHLNHNNVCGEPRVEIYEVEETTIDEFVDSLGENQSQADLADLAVHDILSKRASALNNAGYPAQVEFLLQHGITLKRLIEEDQVTDDD